MRRNVEFDTTGLQFEVLRSFKDSEGRLGAGDLPPPSRVQNWTNLKRLVDAGFVAATRVAEPKAARTKASKETT